MAVRLPQSTVNKLNDLSAPLISYEKCIVAFLKTDRIKRHQRPDGTLYEEIIGAGQSAKKISEYCKTVFHGNKRHEIKAISTTSSTCDPNFWETGTVTTTYGHYHW